jgi:hypothetical protein
MLGLQENVDVCGTVAMIDFNDAEAAQSDHHSLHSGRTLFEPLPCATCRWDFHFLTGDTSQPGFLTD